ncbi:nitrilase-related carbon-nitrogen hydrolase [Thalassomonas sp. RHCl1]|uniref:nitrilase-related carbon-nitrogen hydrolase n=1 Tax=Thalassomonas sp. RHCl1 TaxID=2995320 RepID=UPI00248CD4A6|nr:nitrilase-related carbon-nitrogen hydrolase [Thalassomonas sp. RHCl1]
MRVAVCQFATSLNVQENLETCIRVVDEAAMCKPDLIVLPEFCNSLSWYVDHNQAWHAALTTDGMFLQRIGEQAKKHDCYIVLNVTLRRDPSREHQDPRVRSNISVTSCLFSPLGKLMLQADKQTLFGHEHDFFIPGNKVSEVTATPFGNLGLFSGYEGMTFEAPRELALTGAQLLCHSLSTFARDQAGLHGPARACENKVFLAAANKVGPLIPPEHMSAFSEQYFIPEKFLFGGGKSQIVSADGKILATIAHNEEGFAFADIDVILAEDKRRPDGSELFQQRRPELYQALKQSSKSRVSDDINSNVPASVNAALFATYKTYEQAIEDVCHYIENNLSDIIQLPELFFLGDKEITHDVKQRTQLAYLSRQLIEQISAKLRPFQYVCTSLVIDDMHQAVLISEHGLLAAQQQLHFCQRYRWTPLGDKLNIIQLPLEQGNINVAMLTADDANMPEMVQVAALNNIHVLLLPFDIQEAGEVDYSLLARAAENRICILAASREKNFAQDSSGKHNARITAKKSTGFIANLTTDFTLFTPWKSRKFDGYVNQPVVRHQHGKITKALLHPLAAANKLMAVKTG